MFLDINGNTFTTLSNINKSPSLNYFPNQIYGDNLILWLDFTDKNTLFTNTGCTTNVTAYGDYIRGIRDKSSRQKRLSMTSDTTTIWQWSSNTLNNQPCCLKTSTVSGGTSQTFAHEDANFLTTNADYTLHFVCRFQQAGPAGGANTFLYTTNVVSTLAGLGLNNIAPHSTSVTYVNNGNQPNNLFAFDSLTGIHITSINIEASQLVASSDSSTSIYNNKYLPKLLSTRTAGFNHTTGKFQLFTSSLQPNNFFIQELFIVSGLSTTQQLSYGHQYLRLKYS